MKKEIEMQFCNDCGVMLMHKHGKFVCSKCGDIREGGKIAAKEKMPIKEERGEGALDKKHETMPQVNVQCIKCNNPTSYAWTLQTRAGDEGETSFFRCTKCNHTWREYR